MIIKIITKGDLNLGITCRDDIKTEIDKCSDKIVKSNVELDRAENSYRDIRTNKLIKQNQLAQIDVLDNVIELKAVP